MSDWQKFDRSLIHPEQPCDFLFVPDDADSHIWILCSSYVDVALAEFEQPAFWRPAVGPLPVFPFIKD